MRLTWWSTEADIVVNKEAEVAEMMATWMWTWWPT